MSADFACSVSVNSQFHTADMASHVPTITIMNSENILWQETVPAGHHWSGILRRGTALRVLDVAGGANVSALLFNFEEKLERLNMPDTLKGQLTAFLTRGNVLYSDMGRAMCSITDDSVGWHDTICGPSDAHDIQTKYGKKSYAQARNEMFRNGRDSLLIEIGKYGLNKRDMGSTVNLFSKVTVEDGGVLKFHGNHSKPNDYVTLRFEMDVLLALSTAPHRLDTKIEYSPSSIQLTAFRADSPNENDLCRTSCAQNARAFINTERLYAR